MGKKATPKSVKNKTPKVAKSKAPKGAKKAKTKVVKSKTPKVAKEAIKKATPKWTNKVKSKVAGKKASAPIAAVKPSLNLDFTKILTPLDDRILIENIPSEKTTASGLILIGSAPDAYHRAKVLAVGRGRRNKFGKIRPLDVQTGDKVLYSPHSGSEIKVSGQDLFIIRETDVLGVIED